MGEEPSDPKEQAYRAAQALPPEERKTKYKELVDKASELDPDSKEYDELLTQASAFAMSDYDFDPTINERAAEPGDENK